MRKCPPLFYLGYTNVFAIRQQEVSKTTGQDRVRRFMAIFFIKLKVIKGHFRKRKGTFSNCKTLVRVLTVLPGSYFFIWSLLITAAYQIRPRAFVSAYFSILVRSLPYLVILKCGLVTFKLLLIYICNECLHFV